jgi:amino acid permease
MVNGKVAIFINHQYNKISKEVFLMKKDLWLAIATLVSFTIGAGILSLPFVFSKTGFITGTINIIMLGILVIFLNLMIGEITLRTKSIHQLSGYAGKYLGHTGKKIMLIFLLLEWYSAMIAYTIKMGQISAELLKPFIDISPIILSLVIVAIGSYLVYKGLALIEKSEFWIVLLTFVLIIFIGIICLPKINLPYLDGFQMQNFWLPFGAVLFAFGGAGAMPEIREEIKKNLGLMKPAVIIGTTIAIIAYILFPLFIVGVTGPNTTEEGVIGLGNLFGYKILLLGGLFGVLTMFTSFLAIGLALKEVFKYDCYKKTLQSSVLACALPIVAGVTIMFLNINNAFYKVIDLSGSILFPLTGIMFILIYWAASKKGERKPEYRLPFKKALGIGIITIFVFGMINQLIRIFS